MTGTVYSEEWGQSAALYRGSCLVAGLEAVGFTTVMPEDFSVALSLSFVPETLDTPVHFLLLKLYLWLMFSHFPPGHHNII